MSLVCEEQCTEKGRGWMSSSRRCAGVTNNVVVVVADCDCDSYCDSDCDVDSLICLGPRSDGIILNTQLVSWPQRLNANALLMQLATCHHSLALQCLTWRQRRQRADEPSAWWTVNLTLVNDAWWEHADTHASRPTRPTYGIRNTEYGITPSLEWLK